MEIRFGTPYLYGNNTLSMKQTLDREAFAKAMKTKRVIELNVGVRDVAKRLKISPSTASRMENGTVVEIDSFLRACNWLGVPAGNFIKAK